MEIGDRPFWRASCEQSHSMKYSWLAHFEMDAIEFAVGSLRLPSKSPNIRLYMSSTHDYSPAYICTLPARLVPIRGGSLEGSPELADSTPVLDAGAIDALSCKCPRASSFLSTDNMQETGPLGTS